MKTAGEAEPRTGAESAGAERAGLRVSDAARLHGFGGRVGPRGMELGGVTKPVPPDAGKARGLGAHRRLL